MKTKLPSTSHRVHRDPVIKTDAELKAGEVKGPSKARGHDADGQKIAPQHDDGYAQSKAPVDRPMADNGPAPVGAASCSPVIRPRFSPETCSTPRPARFPSGAERVSNAPCRPTNPPVTALARGTAMSG